MLIELNRKERTSKLEALAGSEQVKKCLLYQDYYNGIHFVREGETTSDYGKHIYTRVKTRSGNLVYDDEQTDKVLVSSNWCKPIVEVIGDFTRGINEPIEIDCENESIKNELEEVWKENDLDNFVQEIAYGAGINGKTFIRLRKRDERIEVFQVDPTTIYEVFNPLTNDRESVIHFFKLSAEDAERLFPDVKITADDEVIYAEEWTNEKLYKFVDGEQIEGNKTLNPYKFIPFIELPANIYRTSDISDAIPLNDELNITLSYINEITKYQAFPLLSPKGTYDQNFSPLTRESLKEVEISPQTILPIPFERIEAGGADQSTLDHLEQLRRDISVVTGVPIKLLTAEVDGNTTGVALQRMMSSVFKQAEVRRSFMKEALKEVNRMILSIQGKGEVETDIVFPEMVKDDINEKLDAALKKQTIGISKETTITELGYDYQEEEGKREEELDKELKRLQDEQSALQPNNQPQSKTGVSSKDRNAKGANKPFNRR